MTNFQKAVCTILSLCFLAVLVWMPEPFFSGENIYRQIPLYCFLESKAQSSFRGSDEETAQRIIAANGQYLTEQIQKEQEAGGSAGENVDNLAADETLSDEERDLPEVIKDQDEEKIPAEEGETQKEDSHSEDKIAEEENEGRDVQEKIMEENGIMAEATEATEPDRLKEEEDTAAAEASVRPHPVIDLSPERLQDIDYLRSQFFIEDPNANVTEGLLNAADFLAADLKLQQDSSAPQILIYHTHSQEAFADSREGEIEDTVVGVGNYLTELLTKQYGYSVIHVTEAFDMMSGEMDRSAAYDYAREYLETFLEENPSVEVIIDLHRDGVPEDRRLVTEIDGKSTAQIMFYNGISNTVSQGEVDYLPNPYLKENLAFSFQLEYQAAEYYPDFYRGIYLAGLRYNLHLRPKSLLLEAGAQTNTVQEVKNAMEPFADILNRVLKGSDNLG